MGINGGGGIGDRLAAVGGGSERGGATISPSLLVATVFIPASVDGGVVSWILGGLFWASDGWTSMSSTSCFSLF